MELGNAHGLVVLRDGEIDVELYGSGEDHRLGDPLGVVDFGPDTLHDVRSVTKSVVSLLYGMALAEGRVPGPAEELSRYFPESPRPGLTVGHALTMTLGLEWDESVPYTSTANSELAMEDAPDRYRYVLERPAVAEPGTVWNYSGGATALLARLVAQGVGEPLEEFARKRLFEPLGVDFAWTAAEDGIVYAAAGLRLTPRGMAAIGQLVLDGGRDLVPGAWLAESLRSHVPVDGDLGYGYQWWVSPEWVAAMGNGGQRILLVPERGMVVALTAGDYDDFTQPSAAAVLEQLLKG